MVYSQILKVYFVLKYYYMLPNYGQYINDGHPAYFQSLF